MSLLHEHRGLSPADSRATGLDRELDLAAERPLTSSAETSRGPGLLVASIVVSSLVLAGIISLVRGVETDSVPSEALASDEGLAVPPLQPVQPEGRVQPDARAQTPAPALASAAPRRVARPAAIRPPSLVPPPPQIVPATIHSPGPRARTHDLGQPSRALEESTSDLPVPVELSVSSPAVEEPATSPSELAPPASEEPTAPILPGVEEPSIFELEPELELESDPDVEADAAEVAAEGEVREEPPPRDEPPRQESGPEAVERPAEARDGPIELPRVVEVEPAPTPV